MGRISGTGEWPGDPPEKFFPIEEQGRVRKGCSECLTILYMNIFNNISS
jgi:hypothetical protein